MTESGLPKLLDEDVLIVTYQAVHELLWNVIKHSQTLEAAISVKWADVDVLVVVVEDRGRGFDHSSMLKPFRSGGGFGLLNLHERLTSVGGHFEIAAVPGDGTRAQITVPTRSRNVDTPLEQPLAAIGVHADDPVVVKKTERRHLADRRRIRILVVEDHPVMRQGLRHAIEGQRDMVVEAEASDGMEAIALARRTNPDVILMDVNLPVMNGIKATYEIKREHPDVVVIGLSMHNNPQMAKAMQRAGASSYFTKGVVANTLRAAIRSSQRQWGRVRIHSRGMQDRRHPR
jgi:CheY-like chemotaxis protein